MASTSTYTMGHIPESSGPQTAPFHSRNISSASSATLYTSTTLHSQPYEPLLRPIPQHSGEHNDIASRQSRHSDHILALPRWSTNIPLPSSKPSFVNEKKSYSEKKPTKRATVLRRSKLTLQALMATWSIYSSVRYFLAFAIYQGVTGQVFALALGAATGLSFAFASCAWILSMTQINLLAHGISVSALVSLRSTLYYLSSICFLGPSIVNLVLLFVWKKTLDIEIQTRYRCRLDMDLIWSTTYSLCNYRNRSWGSWVAIAIIRLLITVTIIIAFHLVASSPQFIPVQRHSKARYPKTKKSHTRLDSYDVPLMNEHSTTSVVVPRLDRESTIQPQPSESTLSTATSPRNRLRNSRSHSSTSGGDGYHNIDTQDVPQHNPPHYNEGFLEQFRRAISAITRETEEGLAFATRSDVASSRSTADSGNREGSPEPHTDIAQPYTHHYDENDDENDFYGPPQTVGLHDYFQSYPEDERVRMLNTYVRRMPTIDSMGTHERELVDSIRASSLRPSSVGASSLNTNRDRRPSTRNARRSINGGDLEISGSESRSRPESLSAQAELMAGMIGRANASEIGELMARGDTIRMVNSQPANDELPEVLSGNGYASTTVESKGSTESKESTSGHSYQTASEGLDSTISY